MKSMNYTCEYHHMQLRFFFINEILGKKQKNKVPEEGYKETKRRECEHKYQGAIYEFKIIIINGISKIT